MLYTAAVDFGASSGRVMTAAYDGDTLAVSETHRFRNGPVYMFDRIYWDIFSLLGEMKEGLVLAAQQYGHMRSIGIDSWAVDFGLLDKRGYLLDSPRHYRDPRTNSAAAKVLEQFSRPALFARTGLQFLPFNTLYQLVAMQAENPELLSAADSLLLIPDLLNYFLTGECRSELTNATTTQFLSPLTQDWDIDFLQQLGLPSHFLSPIVRPGQILGRINDRELMELPTFASTDVVNTTSHDTAAAVVSVPGRTPSYAYISSGTWSLLGTVVPSPILDARAAAANFTNEGGLGNYRFLKNIMGLWLVQETQRLLVSAGQPSDIVTLIQQASTAPAFQFTFNPDDPRLLHPGDIPQRIREICRETGHRPPETTGELVRGIFENLALKYRMALEQLEAIVGRKFDTLHVVGGGSQNRMLNQFTANATGRPVVAGPVEASAMGNALVQLLAVGEIGSMAEMREVALKSTVTETYSPMDTALWDTAYETFCRMMKLST